MNRIHAGEGGMRRITREGRVSLKREKGLVGGMRHGLSPLVATILLIAFAVALGSVVFTYLSVSMTGGMETAGCARYARLGSPDLARDGSYVFDYDGKTVSITLMNEGEVTIVRETVNIIGSEDVSTIDADRRIPPGSVKRLNVPYDSSIYGQPGKIVVTPVFIKAGKDTYCPDGKLVFSKRRS